MAGQTLCALAIAVLVAGLAAGCARASGRPTHAGVSLPGHVTRTYREYVGCTEVFCTQRAQMKTRPAEITPSGDGSLYVTGVTWRDWSTDIAIGTGTAHADNCKPNCAQGTYHDSPATITLTDPKLWRGDMAYTSETVSVPGIHYRFTFRTGLVPGSSPFPPPAAVTQPPTPGPVSTDATLNGSYVMGYEPAYDAGGGNIA